MPAFTDVYGLRPEDFDHMTFGEVDTYIRDLNRRMVEAQRQAARNGG